VSPIQNCGTNLDSVSEGIDWIYKKDDESNSKTKRTKAKFKLNSRSDSHDSNTDFLWFDQRPFQKYDKTGAVGVKNEELTGLDDYGALYVPKSCRDESLDSNYSILSHMKNKKVMHILPECDLHIHFHGCGFTIPAIYRLLVTTLGINYKRLADNENHRKRPKFAILFPRLRSYGSTNEQSQGCWDVYSQIDGWYASKKGVQMSAVWKMVQNLLALKTETFSFNNTRAEENNSNKKQNAAADVVSHIYSTDYEDSTVLL